MPPSPRFMPYEEIRAEADAFLAEHWPTGAVPVDIDEIVDVHLGIDVVPVPYLQSGLGIEGFLSADLTTIYVDEFVYDGGLYRYRFTIAHEVGHYCLHRELYEQADYSSPEDWKEYMASMSPRDYGRYEHQAYCFGGLILAPRDPLAARLAEAQELARAAGHELDLRENEDDRQYVAEWVGRRFDVSAEVILRRGAYDGHWSR